MNLVELINSISDFFKKLRKKKQKRKEQKTKDQANFTYNTSILPNSKYLFAVVSIFIIIGIGIGVAIFFILKPYAYADSENKSASLYDLVRTTVTILGAITIGGAAAIQYRKQRFDEARAHLERDMKYTALLTTAIEHLGHTESSSIRQGALYELRRLALDSDKDRESVMEIIIRFGKEKTQKVKSMAKNANNAREINENISELIVAKGVLCFLLRTQDFDASSIDLKGIDMSRGNLTGSNLFQANLSFSKLKRSSLEKAKLCYATLFMANLRNADLTYADLSNAIISNADLSNAFLYEARLSSAELSFAILYEASLINADLSNAILSNADLSNADLRYADLRYADLIGADLTSANLSGANLTGANIYGAIFKDSNITEEQLASTVSFYVFAMDETESIKDEDIKEKEDVSDETETESPNHEDIEEHV